ncbi:MAG: ribbon-helix-helix protein, CopG family [bacterium]|nr:ribbon-helix-helix protein, CopG family [bacterium]
MNGQRHILNVSVPLLMDRTVRRLARQEQKTTSEVVRDAIRNYLFHRDWARIRRLGEETARRLGIETVDDVERIAS